MPLLDRLGIGTDLQEVAAFEGFREVREARFYERVFTAPEREYCLATASPAEHFAARFAAKEAVVKAMSRFQPISVEEVEVRRGDDGRPSVRLSASGAGEFRFLLSLSHTETQALAVCLAERLDG